MAIDPRIRARRVAVRRAEGRRRLRFLAVAIGLVLVAVAVWGVTRSPLLDLDHIRVDGVDARDRADVLGATELATGTAMFDLDLGAAEAAIADLAWVKSVRAEREWPGTVRISVVERTAVAVLRDDAAAWLVDEEGVIIEPAGADSPLPVVEWTATADEGEAERDALPVIAIARAIPDDLRPWVEAVTEDDEGVWLDLIGAASVFLGDGDLIEDKLGAVRAVLQNVDLACLDVIDVTVADLSTIVRDVACEGTGPAEGDDAAP